jgi:hypothetical protein
MRSRKLQLTSRATDRLRATARLRATFRTPLGIYLGRSFYITATLRLVIVANYNQLNSVEIVAKILILSQSIQSAGLPAYKAFNSTNSRP